MVSWLKVSLGMNSLLPISHEVLEKVMGTVRAEVERTSVGVRYWGPSTDGHHYSLQRELMVSPRGTHGILCSFQL